MTFNIGAVYARRGLLGDKELAKEIFEKAFEEYSSSGLEKECEAAKIDAQKLLKLYYDGK
jgi:hypothetical protein